MLKFIISGFFVALILGGCASRLPIKSYAPTPERGVVIKGSVTRPEGDGPFPGVIILHGCSGIRDNDYDWARRLKTWGYASLILDSYGTRGIMDNCGKKKLSPFERALDAHAAKVKFGALPFVDRDRIGVLGYSEGGITTLHAVNFNLVAYSLPSEARDPFKAAVALYPHCYSRVESNTNVLILIGEKDDWTPATACEMNLPVAHDPSDEIQLKIYPGAYHKFDEQRPSRVYHGHTLEYNSAAMKDAVPRIKSFIDKHLTRP